MVSVHFENQGDAQSQGGQLAAVPHPAHPLDHDIEPAHRLAAGLGKAQAVEQAGIRDLQGGLAAADGSLEQAKRTAAKPAHVDRIEMIPIVRNPDLILQGHDNAHLVAELPQLTADVVNVVGRPGKRPGRQIGDAGLH